MTEVDVVEAETGGVWVKWWRSGVAGGMRVEEDVVKVMVVGRRWIWI